MRPTTAVLVREIVSRRELVLLAVAVAILISLLPLLPNIEGYEASDVRIVASASSALAFGILLALLFGATVFGNDVSEGRLSFYFSRPLSSFAVWWGRAIAAIVMVWVVELIVLAPSFLSGGAYLFDSAQGIGWPATVAFVMAPVVIFLAAHAISIMVRSRGTWLFLDVAGAMAFVIVVWVNLKPLFEAGAEIALWVVAGAYALSLVASLSIGGWCGVAIGRVDLGRTHAALSLALWSALAVCVAAISLYAGQLSDFGPEEFTDVEVYSVSPDGRWVDVVGNARGRLDVTKRCLVSTVDDRWLSLPLRAHWYLGEVVFARGGSTAVWLSAAVGTEPRTMWWADLGQTDPAPRQTNIVMASETRLALSWDGTRVAVLEQETLSVYELGDERLVTAVRLPEDLRRATVFFPSRGSIRLYTRHASGGLSFLVIAAVDTETGRIIRTGRIEGVAEDDLLVLDANLERLVTWARSEIAKTPVRHVYDANDGTLIRSFENAGFPRFLRDGRLLFSENRNGDWVLVVEPSDGGDRIVHHFEEALDISVNGEAVPNGAVLTRLADPSDRTLGRRADVLDVDTGEVRNVSMHLRRGLAWFPWKIGNAGAIFWYRDQFAAARLFLDQSGALVRWDPESGELIHVVGGRQ